MAYYQKLVANKGMTSENQSFPTVCKGISSDD